MTGSAKRRIEVLWFASIAALLIAVTPPSFAERYVVIGLGAAQQQIGVDRGAVQSWSPIFFSVDAKGMIHVPDFYKGRLATFDTRGRLVAAVECRDGISPRMNYFAYVSGKGYATLTDGTLYSLKEDGTVRWKQPLGSGALFEGIYTSELGIQLLPGTQKGKPVSLFYTLESPAQLSLPGVNVRGRVLSVVRGPEGSSFVRVLADMASLAGARGYRGVDAPERMQLVAVIGGGRSVWSERGAGGERVAVFSRSGELQKRVSITYEGEGTGSGFWSVVTDDLKLYKAYFTDRAMEIYAYDLN